MGYSPRGGKELDTTKLVSLSLFHSQGLGRRNGELLLNGYRVPVWGDEVLEMDGGDDCTAL